VLERIAECYPAPLEVLVHIDQSDGTLEGELRKRFPNVRVLTSPTRLGPGGGRHRCFLACHAPYAASFDDDSYPVDQDFFGEVEQLFLEHPNAAIFGASIWHRQEPKKARSEILSLSPSYVGCGFAVRVAAYKITRGFLPRPAAYGMEETDLSLQLYVAGWSIYQANNLRVFHDTDLRHHASPEINAAAITNAGLFAFLHFPFARWGIGLLQVGNRVLYALRVRRFRGICSGLLRIPIECFRHRHYRNAVAWPTLKLFLDFRRTGSLLRVENSKQILLHTRNP
jgi:GT2 family glycosyltransferase